jgi:hypothetical protein
MGMPHQSLQSIVRRIIENITNTFENGTPEYTYGKCEHLNDGRGYTCGRIGFTTVLVTHYEWWNDTCNSAAITTLYWHVTGQSRVV